MGSEYTTCKECGRKFIPSKRRNQLYCSDNCRIVHNNRIFNAKRAERTGPNHVCEQCGKRFYSSHSAPRFCSLECYREHERECRRSRNAATAIARMRNEEKRRKQERDAYLNRRDLEAKAAGLPEERVSIGANGMRIVSRGNCDVGTAEEQAERYMNFCHNYPKCTGCPCVGRMQYHQCEFAWAQMPY